MSSVNNNPLGDQKIKLKFRVTAKSGPNGRWSEKWGVSVFSHEEFQVTDQLLKLPFQGKTPEVIFAFSVPHGKLEFKMIDEDRTASVNGTRSRKSDLKVGDKISIGEQILVEVILAPSQSGSENISTTPEPLVATTQTFSIPLDDEESDGPTLSSVSLEDDFPPLDSLEPNPTLTFAPHEEDFNSKMEQQRMDAEVQHKKKREQAAHDAINFKNQKFSLADSPHEHFDPGFADLMDDDSEKEEPTVESSREIPAPEPEAAFIPEAQFIEEPKVSSRVIHADLLSPPNEIIPTEQPAPHPGDQEATRVVTYTPKELGKEKTQVTSHTQRESRAKAEILEKIKTQSAENAQGSYELESHPTHKATTKTHTDTTATAIPAEKPPSKSVPKTVSKPALKPALKPWIPDFQPLTERVKKRAAIFLGSALLALAIGAFVFVKLGSNPAPATAEAVGSAQVPETLAVETIQIAPLQPGVQLDEIEKKLQSLNSQ